MRIFFIFILGCILGAFEMPGIVVCINNYPFCESFSSLANGKILLTEDEGLFSEAIVNGIKIDGYSLGCVNVSEGEYQPSATTGVVIVLDTRYPYYAEFVYNLYMPIIIR